MMSALCAAQPYETDKEGIGANISYDYYTNNAGFNKLPGIPNCCPWFGSGSGNGFLLSLYYDRRVYDNLFAGILLGYNYFDSEFSAGEKTFVMYRDDIIEGEFTHTIRTYFNSVIVQPYVSYRLFDGFSVGIGPYASLMFNRRYSQKETITRPENAGTFIDKEGHDTGKRTRNDTSGVFPSGNDVFFGTNLTLSYELPLNRDNTLRLVPSFSFGLNISKINTDMKWDAASYRIALGLRYDLTPVPEVIADSFPVRDTLVPDSLAIVKTDSAAAIKIPPDTLRLTVQKDSLPAFKYDTSKVTDTKIVSDTIEKVDTVDSYDPVFDDVQLVTSLYDYRGRVLPQESKLGYIRTITKLPLLSTVYFSEDETSIPSRYTGKRLSAQECLFFSPYFDILDIIGKAMKQDAGLSVTLTGLDRENIKKAGKRAKAVRKYLISKYGIDKKRLTVEADLSAGSGSSSANQYRVEIVPQSIGAFKETVSAEGYILSESAAEFRLKLKPGLMIKNWEIQFLNNGHNLLHSKKAGSDTAAVRFQLDAIAVPATKLQSGVSYSLKLWESVTDAYHTTRFNLGNPGKCSSEPVLYREFIDPGSGKEPAGNIYNGTFNSIIAFVPVTGSTAEDPETAGEVRAWLNRNHPGKPAEIVLRDCRQAVDPASPETTYYYGLTEIRYIR